MKLKFLAAATLLTASLNVMADSFRVIDMNNQPVPEATVMIGYEPGNPFGGNVLKTDMSGAAEAPADWKAALPVTVQAPGYVISTLPILMPGDHVIQLDKQESTKQYEIKGTTTGFGRLITDGKVDFGMVLPALSRENMLAFDISSVISPQNDTIEIIGNTVNLPSNITLPEQEESYIFPITLNKPDYRSYVREMGSYQMYVMHGQFPLQRVVNDIRGGKSIFEVINHFNFIEAGQRPINLTGDMKGVDLAVNQTPMNGNVSVQAPAYPGGKVMISLSLAEKDGLFVPTDLKRLTPNQAMNLKTNSSLGSGSVLSLLLDEPTGAISRIEETLRLLNPLAHFTVQGQIEPKGKQYNFNKMSFAFMPAQGTVSPQFLPMVDKPQIVNNVMKLGVPTLAPGLTAAGTYLVMSEIEQIGTGDMKSERRTRLWEIWATGWLPQVEMPKIAITKRPDRKYRWEVIFLARPSNIVFESAPGDRVDLMSVSHVTRNATDL